MVGTGVEGKERQGNTGGELYKSQKSERKKRWREEESWDSPKRRRQLKGSKKISRT